MKRQSIAARLVMSALLVGTTMMACGNAEPGSGASGGSAGGGGRAGMAGRSSGGTGDEMGGEGGSTFAGTATGAGATMGGTAPSGGGGAGASPADGGAGGAPAVLEPLLPWAVGNSWTYRVTKNSVVSEKTTTVGKLEAVGGSGPSAKLKANHVTTSKGAGSNDHTESWQAPDAANPDRILRFRELTYDPQSGMLQDEVYCSPPKLHIDGSPAHTADGASWTEKYTESTLTVGMPVTSHAVSETWTVISADETLKVPAGTFDHVVHLQKVGAASTKDYWYARGVGKLKETGTQTEELEAYSLK